MQPLRITNHRCGVTILDLSPDTDFNCYRFGAALYAPSGLPQDLSPHDLRRILSEICSVRKRKILAEADFFRAFEGPLVKACYKRRYAITLAENFPAPKKTFFKVHELPEFHELAERKKK